ncbi:MAG: translocation/assembly module TamB domain-containing protein [Acidobacteria bacterium]|nr:translocation/assembly module TamB domain-containing protein [Acidobacteriota bacterium]MDW7984201.1 translocation/assembly module TamB domain-containing protein [Acidobacteriota bacterium]
MGRRRRWFRLAAWGFLLVLVGAAVGVYLWAVQTAGAQTRALVERFLRETTRQDVTIGRAGWNLLHPSVTFKDITWYTRGPQGRQAFAYIERLEFRFWWRALFRRHLVIRSITLGGVRIQAYYDTRGQANWPSISIPREAVRGIRFIDVRLEALRVERLEFYLRHDKIPLLLGLPQVRAYFHHHPVGGHLAGGIRIEQGFLRMYDYNPWTFQGGIQVRLNLDGPTIDQAHLWGDGYHLWGSGRVVGYGSPQMDLTLIGQWDNRVIQRIHDIPFRVEGRGSAVVHYDGGFSRFRMQGWVRSVPYRMGRQVFDEAAGPVYMTHYRLNVYGAHGRLTGTGRVLADFQVDPLFGDSRFRLFLAVQGADADRFGQMWGLQKIHHAATWGGSGAITWRERQFDRLTGWMALRAEPRLSPWSAPVPMEVKKRPYLQDWSYPVRLTVLAELEGYRFRHLTARGRLGQTSAEVDGWVAFDGPLELRVRGRTESIYEVDVYYHQWEWNLFPDLRPRIQMWEIGGRGEFAGTLSNRIQDIAIDGRFRGERIVYLGVLWGDGEADVRYWHRIYQFRNVRLEDGPYRAEADEALLYLGEVDFRVDGDSYAEVRFLGYPVERVLAPTPLNFIPLRGTLRGLLTVRGNYQQVDLWGDLSLTEGRLADLDLDYGILRFSYVNFLLRVDEGRISYRTGLFNFAGQWHRLQGIFQDFRVQVRALPLHRSPLGQRWQVAGTLDLYAIVEGPWRRPTLDIHGHAEALQWQGYSLGDLMFRQTDEGLGLEVWLYQGDEVRGHGIVQIDVAGGQAEGTWTWRQYQVPFVLDMRVSGQARGEAWWDPGVPLQASLTLEALTVDYRQHRLTVVTPEAIRWDGTRLTYVVRLQESPDTDVRLDGWLRPLATDVPMEVRAVGQMALRWLETQWPGLDARGQVRIDATVRRGSSPSWQVEGTLETQEASLYHLEWPVRIERLQARIEAHTPVWRVVGFQATVSGGTVEGAGQVLWRPPGDPDYIQASFHLKGATLNLHPYGSARVSGAISLSGYPHQMVLTADWTVDAGTLTWEPRWTALLAPRSAETPVFPRPAVPPPPVETAFWSRLQLNVRSTTLTPVRVRVTLGSTGLQSELVWSLQVTGTLHQPVFIGVATLRSGQAVLLNRLFDIQEGQIQFTNPLAVRPVVRIVGTSRIQNYFVTAVVTGPIDQLSLQLTSDPPLNPRAILNLLGGQTYTPGQSSLEESATFFTSLGSGFLTNVLAQSIQPIGQFQRFFGIDRLSVDLSQLGPEARLEPRLTVGKQFSPKWNLTYSIGLTTAQTQILLLEYLLNEALRVIVSRDESGAWGADLLWQP